jgi:predicted nucleotidyltransferase
MDSMVDQLIKLFESDENCLMAYLFGSHSKGKANKESDIDIAVYLKDFSNSTTTDLWNRLEDLLKKNVDLIILNNARATIAWEAICGKKLLVRDQNLYIEFMLDVSQEAEDFRDFVEEIYQYREKQRISNAI